MYSSNPNPFNVCLPPSLFPHHSTLHEIFLQYPYYNQFQEQPLSNDEFFPVKTNVDPSPPFIIENAAAAAATTNAVVDQYQYPQCGGYLMGDKKSRAKKDRHSMIFTAQGLRHRRVRLSIDIAQKFFNLQDMLGFDKASQTLDWLFTNSKTDIQELVQINNHNNLPFYISSSSTCDQCDDQLENLSQNKGARRILNSKNKSTRALAVDHHIAKVSREKARERARERTREKQRIRKELIKKHDNRLISSSSEIALPVNETPWKDLIVEAILTKKPLKSSPMYIYQQNMPLVPEEIKFQSQLFSQYY